MFFLLISSQASWAWTERILREPDPFTFKPSDLSLQDFKLDGPVLWEWLPDTFEWVRTNRVLQDKTFFVARGKVQLQVSATSRVTYQGQVYLPNPEGKVEVLVVLTEERTPDPSGSPIHARRNEIVIEDFATKKMVRVPVVFAPKTVTERVVFDSNCSGLPIKLVRANTPNSWVNFSCRAIHHFGSSLHGGAGFGNKLDLDIYWLTENGSSQIWANGRPVELSDHVSTSIAVDYMTQRWVFTRQSGQQTDEVELEIQMPSRFRPLGVSLGIGPYSHQNVIRAFPTIYASWFFNEQLKLGMFGAFPVRSSPEIDVGLYLIVEQARLLDERLLLNLLFGFHGLSFVPAAVYRDERQYAFSAPQGIELIFRDAFLKGQNIMLGSFFYPLIKDRSYINSWFRYGGSTFFELNFIQWQEPLPNGETFGAKSFGLSVGFPLFRAF